MLTVTGHRTGFSTWLNTELALQSFFLHTAFAAALLAHPTLLAESNPLNETRKQCNCDCVNTVPLHTPTVQIIHGRSACSWCT